MLALGSTVTLANVCPTGQTDCHMKDMAETMSPAGICVLACGVVLPVEIMAAPDFLGSTSTLPLPDALKGVSFLSEPAFRPPRFLA
jgi:hypothetical protein